MMYLYTYTVFSIFIVVVMCVGMSCFYTCDVFGNKTSNRVELQLVCFTCNSIMNHVHKQRIDSFLYENGIFIFVLILHVDECSRGLVYFFSFISHVTSIYKPHVIIWLKFFEGRSVSILNKK